MKSRDWYSGIQGVLSLLISDSYCKCVYLYYKYLSDSVFCLLKTSVATQNKHLAYEMKDPCLLFY